MQRYSKPPALGSLLRQRRRQLDLTQAQVAAKVGCRANYVGYLESGARHPSPTMVVRLAKTLDLDPQELLLLANPQVRAAMTTPFDSRASAWQQFKANKQLHTRNCITRAEIAALERVATLGPVRNQRDFLFILQTIRQALTDE